MIFCREFTNYRVSIVTPTYNRADKLSRVYNGLKSQTYHNFEWIVIDDASTDNTQEVIDSFRSQKPFFPIIYYKKEHNTGVVNTLGASLPFIQGDFVLKCDSDDEYMCDMLEVLLKAWNAIPVEKRSLFRAVSAPVVDQKGRFYGKALGSEFLDTTYLDLEHKLKRRTERLWLERADLWALFDFSEGIADHLIWYPDIVRDYKIRCIDKPLRIYYRGEEGCVTLQLNKKTAYMRFTSACATLNREMDYFFWDPVAISYRATNVWLYAYALGYSWRETSKSITDFWGRVLLWIMFPVGLMRIILVKRRKKVWL